MDNHTLFFLLRRALLPVAGVFIILIILAGLMAWAWLKKIWTNRKSG